MLDLYIGSAYAPKTVSGVNPNTTIRELFGANGITIPRGAIVMKGSVRLGDADLDKTLSSLGVTSGEYLTISEKYAGAK